jgi:hypothetical protein
VAPRFNEVWRRGESNVHGILVRERFNGIRWPRENCDATAIGQRREILSFRAHTFLLLAGQFVEKNQFNKRRRQRVPEKSSVAQTPTDTVSADGEGEGRFVHDAIVPQLTNPTLRPVTTVHRVCHGKVCRTRA